MIHLNYTGSNNLYRLIVLQKLDRNQMSFSDNGAVFNSRPVQFILPDNWRRI